MLRTIDRGIRRKGVVTARYPSERYEPHEGHMGAPRLDAARCRAIGECVRACPTGAISLVEGRTVVDLGSCIFCGECERACPEGAMRMTKEFELASRTREGLSRDRTINGDSPLERSGRKLEARIKRAFGRSLSIREVDAGSCNGCEVEVNSLTNAVHDIERFGLHIVASPRHADVLLVTGPVTRNMEHALLQAYRAAPDPKLVMAMGACACSGGVFKDCYATRNGVDPVLPVDVYIPGCPPRPQAMIHAFMMAVDKIQAKRP
jgi:Ni,Fe-hydrogenase III small subunit/ferredoxin